MVKVSKKQIFVSIIIPFHWGLKKENYDRFVKDFKYLINLEYKNYEILLVSNVKATLPYASSKIKLLKAPHKMVSPSEKRDYALRFAKGKICAFIDDDAYPHKNWIKNAVKHFKNKDIVAVGGPGITPPTNSFWQKIGGYIIESYLCSGGVQHRFYNGIKKKLFVKDYPAYNLFIRKDILKKVGGYASKFYGGEDTYLCIRLIKFGKILYDSDVLVYHHRRSFLIPHLKQISNVGLHRGYFFKKYPENSRHFFYTLPSILTIGFLTFLILSLFDKNIFLLFLFFNIFFIILGTISIKVHRVSMIPSVIAGFGIIATHITYGVFFIKGLFKNGMET